MRREHLLRRWITFNAVCALGLIVQLGRAVLVSSLPVSLLAAGGRPFDSRDYVPRALRSGAGVDRAGVDPLVLDAAGGVRATGTAAAGVELLPHTLHAWNAYDGRVRARLDGASADSTPFFALDAFGAGGWRATAVSGGVAMARIERPDPQGGDVAVRDGKVHHWAGAIFVPNASPELVLERLSALAGQEARYYKPEVAASRLLSRDGDRYRIYMKLRRSKLGVAATYNTEHEVAYRRLGVHRATGRSVATRVAELTGENTAGEHEKPAGSDRGFLWKLNAYWRYEATRGGVLIECESVSLSRGVPALARLFVSGLVEGLARESLERTLTGLRAYLTHEP